jgi:hypothetical protein
MLNVFWVHGEAFVPPSSGSGGELTIAFAFSWGAGGVSSAYLPSADLFLPPRFGQKHHQIASFPPIKSSLSPAIRRKLCAT